jgi:hypothetical protein
MNTQTMKDNWTKAFQEKLGDYELELPAPAAAGRRTGRILPLLLSGAAAALLLLVLLRTPEQTRPEPLSRLISEAQPTLDAPVLNPLAPVTLLPERRRRVATAQPTVTQQAVAPLAQAQPEPEPEPAAIEPVAVSDNEEVMPASQVVEPAASENWTEDWPEEPASHQRTRISGRVHIDPSLLRSRANAQEPISQLLAEYFSGSKRDLSPELNFAGVGSPMDLTQGEVRCDFPVKAGISLQLNGPGRFAFGTGLDYAFHRSRISYPKGTEWEYRMHYIGLPLRGIFTLIDAKRLNWYAAAGGEVEWMVAGRLYKRNGQQENTVEAIDRHPFLFSLTAATGLEFKLSEQVGFYAEPGIALYAQQKGDLPDYYREHPLSFDLRVGVRFDL